MTGSNPFTSMFTFQRTVIEQSHRATRRTVEGQQAAFDAFLDATEASRTFSDRTARLSREAVRATVDALDSMNGGEDLEEVRTAFDEQFAASDEVREAYWDAITDAMAEGNEAFDEVADQYLDALDRSFDAFLDAHEQAQANVRSVADNVSAD